MFNNHDLTKMELGGTLNNTRCVECGHVFRAGNDILISDALFKVIDGKLVLDDHNPTVICFPEDSDGHYSDNNS